LSEGIREEIEQWLRSGGFEVGTKLPSERELAQRFGVSRPVIREAVKALEQKGMVSVHPGSGVFVRGNEHSAAVAAVANSMSSQQLPFSELVESRLVLEAHITGLAALRRSSDHLALLRTSLKEMEGAVSKMDRFLSADGDFHMVVAKATGNRVFATWMQPVMQSLAVSRLGVAALGEVRERILACHINIYREIEASNREGASVAAIRHIEQFLNDTRLAMSMGILPAEPLPASLFLDE